MPNPRKPPHLRRVPVAGSVLPSTREALERERAPGITLSMAVGMILDEWAKQGIDTTNASNNNNPAP